MIWWIWVSVGIVLAIGEALVPGTIFLMFFSLAACLVGAVSFFKIDLSLSHQLTLFAITSVALVVFLRPIVLSLIMGDDAAGSSPGMIGQRAVCINDIPVGHRGRIELRGTCWNALNVGDHDLRQGAEGLVAAIEGLLVHVRGTAHAEQLTPEAEPEQSSSHNTVFSGGQS